MQDFDLQSPGASGPVLQCQSEPQSQGSVPPPSYHSIPDTVVAHISSERGAPPSYDEDFDPHEPPPSYDSLFGRVRHARKASKGMLDFVNTVILILLGTIGCSIVLCTTVVIPICMIAMGSIYLHDCPQSQFIPIYLIVEGVFAILKQLLPLSAKVRRREEEQEEERIRQSPTQAIINCFMVGWFIAGSVWVYKEYEPNYDPSLGKYCNRTLYLFAFWLITSMYIFLGVFSMCLCSISLVSVAFLGDV